MAAPDLDVIKEIPGYKVILKAVLKSQIQQLVEQLAANTDEESVILTASVADGTLSHLGSESGKTFLEDHEDIKSQFLGHCLKRHHRKKQAEKERLEAETLQQSMQQTSPVHYGGAMGGPFSGRSPRFSSPRGPIHPVALTRASPGATGRSPSARHEPYPVVRPKRTSLNFEPSRGPGPRPSGTIKGSEQVIKIEPDDGETSNQSESGSVSQDNIQSTSQSPQQSKTAAKSESEDKDDDAKSESSNSTIPNEPPAEGLSLDSDLSNLISEQNQQHSQQGSDNGEMDPNVRVKLEALAESEMDLEITGVEPGRPQVSQDNWNPNVSMGMNFDPTGATGSAGDTPAGYRRTILDYEGQEIPDQEPYPVSLVTERDVENNPESAGIENQFIRTRSGGIIVYRCLFNNCNKMFSSCYKVKRHLVTHTNQRPYRCIHCEYRAARLDTLESHVQRKHNLNKSITESCFQL